MISRDQETFEETERKLDDYVSRIQAEPDLDKLPGLKEILIYFVNEFRKPPPREPIRRIGQTDAS